MSPRYRVERHEDTWRAWCLVPVAQATICAGSGTGATPEEAMEAARLAAVATLEAAARTLRAAVVGVA